MTNLYDLNSGLYTMSHVKDTSIVNGMYADDTLRVVLDDGSTIVYGSFLSLSSGQETDCFVFTDYFINEDGEEETLSEGGYYECTGDVARDVEGLHDAILRFCNIDH